MELLFDTAQKHSSTAKIAENIYAADLLPAFNHYKNQIKVLSLDCFDTILFRKTATPTDVFFAMQNQPAFKTHGITATLRLTAEAAARKIQMLRYRKEDVTLQEIYQTYSESLTLEEIHALTEDELTAEMEVCYGFPPILELIRAAHAAKMKIIIVSDTYFKKTELLRLLQHTLPADILGAIDIIFCSSEYATPKRGKLFQEVLKQLNIPAHEILHIGDNPIADLYAAKRNHLHALRLLHHPDSTQELLRFYYSAAALANPNIRQNRPLYSPFKGVFTNAKTRIGYRVLGPLMYGFARFVINDIEQLTSTGLTVKVAFLMRDAYLPALACAALADKIIGKNVRISRFTAYAATFRTREDVDRYLAEVITSNRFQDIAKQLLLPEEITTAIIQHAMQQPDPALSFAQQICQNDILKMIFSESAKIRGKLKKYLDKELNLQSGDTLIFVDLGYSGTAQRLLTPLFAEEYNIHIRGCYLLALSTPKLKKPRSGFLDEEHFDNRFLMTLVSYIALLEQMCTSSERSVVSYDDDGNPLLSDSSFSDEQYKKLHALHEDCLDFIKDTRLFLQQANTDIPLHMLRDNAAAELTRLLFMPTRDEIDYLQSFEFDLNLGTKDTFDVFNIQKGLNGLKRRGLFSVFMEKSIKTFRTNAPAELRYAGLELSLALFAQHRFTLEFNQQDLSLQKEKINVICTLGNESTQAVLEAQATYGGYYAVIIPLGVGNLQIALLLGQKYQWIEIESAELIPLQVFMTKNEAAYAEDYWSKLLFNQMENRGGKLFECQNTDSFVMINPQLATDQQNRYALRLVFRPIVMRG